MGDCNMRLLFLTSESDRVTDTEEGEISAKTDQPCASCMFYFRLSVNNTFGFYFIIKMSISVIIFILKLD